MDHQRTRWLLNQDRCDGLGATLGARDGVMILLARRSHPFRRKEGLNILSNEWLGGLAVQSRLSKV